MTGKDGIATAPRLHREVIPGHDLSRVGASRDDGDPVFVEPVPYDRRIHADLIDDHVVGLSQLLDRRRSSWRESRGRRRLDDRRLLI